MRCASRGLKSEAIETKPKSSSDILISGRKSRVRPASNWYARFVEKLDSGASKSSGGGGLSPSVSDSARSIDSSEHGVSGVQAIEVRCARWVGVGLESAR